MLQEEDRLPYRPQNSALFDELLTDFHSRDDCRTPAQIHRQSYLRLIAEKRAEPLVEVFGQSASGKSTTIKRLDSVLGISPSMRYTTRPARANDDSWFEQVWRTPAVLPTPAAAESDGHPHRVHGSPSSVEPTLAPSDTLFAIFNYGNYYGTGATEVASKLLSHHSENGVSVLLGKLLDLPNFHEAVNNMLPLWPSVPLRLMVDPYQLRDRLERRAASGGEARPGEVAERLAALSSKFLEDQSQIPAYCELYDLVTMYVPLKSEIERFAIRQVCPLDESSLQAWLPTAISEARERAATRASDALRKRILPTEGAILSPSASEILLNKVLPAVEEVGIPYVYLSGLAGIAAYVAEYPSFIAGSELACEDRIAFVVPTRPEYEEKLQAFADALSSAMMPEQGSSIDDVMVRPRPVSTRATIGIHSSKGVQVLCGDVMVDAGLVSRISSVAGAFSYELPCDHTDQIVARELSLSDECEVCLLPPEHLLIETLLRWHGSREDLRLLDGALALLATQEMDWNVIHKLIFCQQFSPELDARVVSYMRERGVTHETVEDVLAELLPDSKSLTSLLPKVLRERKVDLSKPADLPTDNTPSSSLSVSALKQTVMIGQLSSALDALLRHLNSGDLHMQPQDLSRFSNGRASSQLLLLQKALGVFRDFQVGRGDIYVRRDMSQSLSPFFDTLISDSRG